MGETFTGVVQKHLTKPWGSKVFYSFTLQGRDGIFGTGLSKPPAVGASITFEARTNPKGFLEADTKTIQYRADGEPTTAVVPKSNGGLTKDQYWTNKEARDIKNDAARELGATRNTAIAIIDLMLKHEAIPLPKKLADRQDYLFEVLDKYTNKLMGKGYDSSPKAVEAKETSEAEITKEEENWT